MSADPAIPLLAAQQDVRLVDHVSRVVHLNFADPSMIRAARSRGASVFAVHRDFVAVSAARAAAADSFADKPAGPSSSPPSPPAADNPDDGRNRAPDARVLHGFGVCALPDITDADLVLLRIPKDRASLEQLLHDAHKLLRIGGHCVLAGGNNEGVKTAARTMSGIFGNAEAVAHRSGHRAVIARRESAVTIPGAWPCDRFSELNVTLRDRPLTLFTRPGVFSWEHLDEATAMLADVMEIPQGAAVLDLGCGAGALGTLAALLNDGAPVYLVDSDSEAVRCAQRTATAAGAHNTRVLASDVASAVDDMTFDVVVTNPPFHSGRLTDLALPVRFIDAAHRVLRPGGMLFLVANRTLPYEREMNERFGNVRPVRESPRFKVLAAQR